MLSPCLTMMPPFSSPPTTSQRRASPFSARTFSCLLACLLASSFAVDLRRSASSLAADFSSDSASCASFSAAIPSCAAVCFQPSKSSCCRLCVHSSLGVSLSMTKVWIERAGASTGRAPLPAIFNQNSTSHAHWFSTTTARLSSPIPCMLLGPSFTHAVTSSASRLVPQTTRLAPGRMKRARCDRNQKQGWKSNRSFIPSMTTGATQ
mmetsp:Transcript_83082/g.144293  ORF Transcript_83082/g.144293 Transcript_83082/m.144293 type:complete len:207 (+) Transcript_83082:187-807(+)